MQKIPFVDDNWRHLGGLNHFSLLSHPQVYDVVREWLSGPPPADSPAAN